MASADQLKNVEIFKGQSDDVLEEISSVIQYIKIRPDKYIVKIGDVAREMFFVIEGTVKFLDSKGEEIGRQKSGTFFGELSLLYNVPRTCSVQAVNEVELGVLRKNDLHNLNEMYPEIVSSISKLGQLRFANFQKELQNFRPKSFDNDSETFNEEQVIQFKLIFSYYSEGSDQLNPDQFRNMLEMIMNTGHSPGIQESNHIFNKLDTNKDGIIKFDDFLNGIHHLSWVVGNVPEHDDECINCKSFGMMQHMSPKVLMIVAAGLVAVTSLMIYIRNSPSKR